MLGLHNDLVVHECGHNGHGYDGHGVHVSVVSSRSISSVSISDDDSVMCH